MGEARLPQTACWGYDSIRYLSKTIGVSRLGTFKGAVSAASIDRVAEEKQGSI